MSKYRLFKLNELNPYDCGIKRLQSKGGSGGSSGSVDMRYERLEEKIKELEAHVRKLVADHHFQDIGILEMIQNLPETNELVKVKLIRDELFRNIAKVMSGCLGKINIDIESLIDKSKTFIERRLDNIE